MCTCEIASFQQVTAAQIDQLTGRISELEEDNRNLRMLDETIRRNTAMFEALLEHNPGGIALIGANRRIVRVVRPALGFTDGEVVGLSLEAIVHPEDQNILVDCCQQLLDGRARNIEYEGRVCCPDGAIKWMLATFTDMLDDPNVQAIVCNYSDITGRKDSELVMAEFAAMVQNDAQAVFSEDLDGRILTWNPGAGRLFGYSADEIAGCHVRTLIPPEMQDEEQQAREAIRETARAVELVTVRLAQKGARIPVRARLAPVLDRYGRPRALSHSSRVIAGNGGDL